MKNKLQGIFNTVESLSHEPNAADLTVNFLNNEIQQILKPKDGNTIEENNALILISTCKHSVYYWKK